MPDKGNFCAVIQAQEPTAFGCDLSQKAEGIGYTKEVAPCIAPGTHAGHGSHVVSWNGDTTPKASEDVSVTLRSQQGGEGVGVAHVSHGQARECKDVVPPLMAHSGPNRHGEGSVSTTEFTAVIQEAKAFTASDRSNKAAWEGDISGTINCQMNSESSNLQMGVRENLTVRRLTPIECERLQGFPDNWTSEKMELILEGNEWKATSKVVKQADGPRYKAMGNAVTVNVAEWIGKQIGKVLSK
jgi:DNA (cytosine-5)-methyltransferase 1